MVGKISRKQVGSLSGGPLRGMLLTGVAQVRVGLCFQVEVNPVSSVNRWDNCVQ
jgi:hypothetical protein